MTSPKYKTSNQNHRSAILSDFEQSLTSKVSDHSMVSAILEDIQEWTGGQRFLTQLLCDNVIKYADQMDKGLAAGIVAKVVQQKIVQDWENNSAADHLTKIRREILDYTPRESLFLLYVQVLQRGSAIAKQSVEQETLLKAGLVRLEDNQLVANAIYSKIFNIKWAEQLLPGITERASIASTQESQQSSWLDLLPKIALAIGGVAILTAYFRGPRLVGSKSVSKASSSSVPTLTANNTPYEKKDAPVYEKTNPPAYDIKGKDKGTPAYDAKSKPAYDAKSKPAYDAKKSVVQLKVLGDTFSGYSTFRNAEFKSALKKGGVELKYDDEFDQSLRAQKLSEGKAELMVTTLDQFLQQKPKGKIIGLLDRTIGADAVVLNTKAYPNLKSLINLSELVEQERAKGKKPSITYAADTPSEYLALVLDTKFDDFNLSDFELKPAADASEAWALMQDPKENVVISVLWEPFVTQARQEGYSVVLSSNDAPTAIVDVLVASDQLIESNPSILSPLLENYYRRIDANARDATQLQTQVAEDGNLSVSDASAIINGIDFFNAIESENWMNSGILDKRIGATAAVLTLSNRLEEVTSDPKSLYTDQFLTEAIKNSETLISLIRADNPALADKLAGTRNDTVTPVRLISAAEIQQATDIGNLQVRGEVSFSTGSAELTEEGKQTLNQLSSELKEFNDQTVAARVIGHTSRTGDSQSNQRLSQERTRVVVNHLRGMGVTLNIVPEGKGFTDPLPNIDPADARNQRTEIRLVRVN